MVTAESFGELPSVIGGGLASRSRTLPNTSDSQPATSVVLRRANGSRRIRRQSCRQLTCCISREVKLTGSSPSLATIRSFLIQAQASLRRRRQSASILSWLGVSIVSYRRLVEAVDQIPLNQRETFIATLVAFIGVLLPANDAAFRYQTRGEGTGKYLRPRHRGPRSPR